MIELFLHQVDFFLEILYVYMCKYMNLHYAVTK